MVQRDVVVSGVAGFNLGLHASRILCLDLGSSRTGSSRNEVDVVEIHRFLNTFRDFSKSGGFLLIGRFLLWIKMVTLLR